MSRRGQKVAGEWGRAGWHARPVAVTQPRGGHRRAARRALWRPSGALAATLPPTGRPPGGPAEPPRRAARSAPWRPGSCPACSPTGGHPVPWRPQRGGAHSPVRPAPRLPRSLVTATLPPTSRSARSRAHLPVQVRSRAHLPVQVRSRAHPTPSRPPPCAGPSPAAATSLCRSPPRPPSCHMSSCGALSQDRAVRGDPARPGAAQFPVTCAPADASERIVAAPGALEGPPSVVRCAGLAVRITTMTSDRNVVPPAGRPVAGAGRSPGRPVAATLPPTSRPARSRGHPTPWRPEGVFVGRTQATIRTTPHRRSC
jgi:hypothetical protein